MTILWAIGILNLVSAVIGVAVIMRQRSLADRLWTFATLAAALLLGSSSIVTYYQWRVLDRWPELMISFGVLCIFIKKFWNSRHPLH